MNVGMLWLDTNKKRPLAEKVRRAADYYAEKYGREPELCFVPPTDLEEEKQQIDEIVVKPDKTILPQHLWLGAPN